MWSVWSERVDVYLGTGLVLVQRPGQALWSHTRPATLPLGDVLNQVDEACERSRIKPWRLHVHLSAVLCPPVAFTIPAGVKDWREAQAIAQATAVAAWGMPPGQTSEVVCALDSQHAGFSAAMLTGTQQQVRTWAGVRGGRLVSMQPLWAAVTSARACRANSVQDFTLHEPDALTVLNTSGPAPSATSWAGPLTTEQARALVSGWIQSQPVSGAKTEGEHSSRPKGFAVRFSAKPVTVPSQWRDRPNIWAAHWEAVT